MKLILKIIHIIIISMHIKIGDSNLDDIFVDEKPYKNVLVDKISCKTLIGAKALRIRFDKVDGFIRVYNGARYLVLFGVEKYGFI